MTEIDEQSYEEDLTGSFLLPGENQKEGALRPLSFSDLIGQNEVVKNLKVFVEAAKLRQDVLDHVLLYGPPGLGKTTIASILGHEMQKNVHVTSGPAIERKDLAGILSHLEEGDILFIDEIHRMSVVVEEILYPAMEDYKIDFIIRGQGDARAFQIDIPKFTLVGATTKSGMLTGPMRDRFGILSRLDFYSVEDLKKIVMRSAALLGLSIDDSDECSGALEIAKRSRGTPRIANRLLRRVRDFAQIEGDGSINSAMADFALNRLGVDKNGLNHQDRRYLEVLKTQFKGGPVGIETISAALSEDSETIETVVEPFLLQEGYIQRTPRGRVLGLGSKLG